MNPFRPGLGGNSTPSSAQNPDQRKPRKKKAVTTQAALSSIPRPYLATAPSSSLHPTSSRPLDSNPNANLILPSSYIKAARPGREGGYAAGLLSPPNVVPGGSSLPPRNVGRRERPSSPAAVTHGLTVLQARNPNASSSALSLPLQTSSSPRANAAEEPRPRRKRRIVRPQVSTNLDDEGEPSSTRIREPPPATREEGSRRALGRGASMRRVNLWDDVPDSEEAPPPFPYPSPSSVRQPPSFTPAVSASLDPVPEVPPALPPERERSPPPSWEVAVATLGPSVTDQPSTTPASPVPPSNAGSDGETVFASAPSSPTGTTVTTNPDLEDDEDEEQRLDRIMWNADLLAGYTLAERVERERLRRSRTVKRGRGMAGARGGLRPMEPLELPPVGSTMPARRTLTETPSRSYVAATSRVPTVATAANTEAFNRISSDPTTLPPSDGSTPVPASASTSVEAPSREGTETVDSSASHIDEPTTPTQAKCDLAESVRTPSPSPISTSSPHRAASLTMEASQQAVRPVSPEAELRSAGGEGLQSPSSVGIPASQRAITALSLHAQDEAELIVAKSTAPAQPIPTPPDSIPKPPTPPPKDLSPSPLPLESPPVTSLPEPTTPVKTPAKPAPLFSKRPTISVSRPSPLSSGRARVQRRSSISRSAASAASSRSEKAATGSPRIRMASGQASISATPPSMYGKEKEAVVLLPDSTPPALPPNREAALRRRDLLAKIPEPTQSPMKVETAPGPSIVPTVAAAKSRTSPVLASAPVSVPVKQVSRPTETAAPTSSVETSSTPSPTKPRVTRSPAKATKPEPVLIDLNEDTSLPPIQATSPMNFGFELEKMLSGYGREKVRLEPTSPIAGPSRLAPDPYRLQSSRPAPALPPSPWRASKEGKRDELAEAFDDLMNFGSQTDSKATSPITEVARKPSVSTKRLAPTRRPPHPPPPSRALRNKARNNHPYLSGSPSSSTSSVTDMTNVAAAAGRSMPNLTAPRSPAPRIPPRLPPRPDRAKLTGPRAFRPPPPPPPRPWARPTPADANPTSIDEAEFPEPSLSRALLSGRAASVNDLHAAQNPPTGDVRRASAIVIRPSVELEYTDLDVLASRLEGTGREYEGLANITDFLGPGATRGASPAALSSLLLGPVEEESRRIAANGKVKLKLSLLGVRVGKCPICLSQFKENDLAVMLPACGHVGHEECARQWLKRDARCFVCREVLEEVV